MKVVQATAKMILGGSIAFIVLNVVIALCFMYYDSQMKKHHNIVSEYYDMDIGRFYPGLSPPDIDRLINESYQPVQYEPFVGFRERPRRGRFVNVSEDGYRLSSDQAPWPPSPGAPIIFVFGGSTTFGYGVEDKDTVVSRLTERLRRHPTFADAQIYNFGRGFYWSTQEFILLQRLVADQRVPTMAVFIDGMNDFYHKSNDPVFSDDMKSFFEQTRDWSRATGRDKWNFVQRSLQQTISFLPFSRLVRDIQSSLTDMALRRDRQSVVLQPSDPKGLEFSIRSYRLNVSMIKVFAREFGIKPFFVWQPAPMYHNPPRLNEQHERDFAGRRPEGYGPHSQSYYGYPKMADVFAASRDDGSMIWCADSFEGATGSLYVDLVHYNANGAGLLADCIASRLTAAN
jgi:hypothetical protein